MADDDSPRNADFVGRVVSDAKNPPETRMLTGWFGDAAEEGYRRLYANAELSSYVDIPTDAILYTEPIRDVQPAGGVFVWIKRDAGLKCGGSASSRAARFLQGQVTQDFASGGGGLDLSSPEKAGYRCVTQVPCGEPTGFTGRCTKQPDVGGAWPCITAIPLCAAEPTGFTGQCTHQPWPNPTRYIGCTHLHCPTQDLTHIQHICNVVATGLPGCPVVNLPGGEQEQQGADVAEGEEGGGAAARAAALATSLPGCGYTQTWGLCETQLLGCGFTHQGCQPTQPPKCNVSVDIPCITQTETPRCQGGFAGFAAAAPGARAITTEVIQCNPSAVDACPTRFGCETQPPTTFCTQLAEACPTTLPFCPETSCGPRCQTQQQNCTQMSCTQVGTQCPTLPNGDCTFFGCPPTPATVCTQSGPQCPTQFGSGCPTDAQFDCTFGCTQFGPNCPTINLTCPTNLASGCNPNMVAARSVACPQLSLGAGCPTPACPPRSHPFLACTLFDVGCPPLQVGTAACPVTSVPAACPPRSQAFVFCTAFGPQCPPLQVATAAGPQCQRFARAAAPVQEPTPATVCFICTQVPWLCPVAQ